MVGFSDIELLKIVETLRPMLEEKVQIQAQQMRLAARLKEIDQLLQRYRAALAHGLLQDAGSLNKADVEMTLKVLKGQETRVLIETKANDPKAESLARAAGRAVTDSIYNAVVETRVTGVSTTEQEELTSEDLNKTSLVLAYLHALTKTGEKFDARDAARMIYPDAPSPHVGARRIHALVHHLVQSGRAKRGNDTVIPMEPLPKEPVRFPNGMVFDFRNDRVMPSRER